MDIFESLKKRLLQRHLGIKSNQNENETNQIEADIKKLKNESTLSNVQATQQVDLKSHVNTIGLATFNQNFTEQLRQQLVSVKVQNYFHLKTWISRNYYFSPEDRQSLPLIFPFIKKAECQKLQFYQFDQPFILKNILRIEFPHLKQLLLDYCEILSIEALLYVDAPNLSVLSVRGNCISIIKPLQKYKGSSEIESINTHSNLFSVIDISRMKLPLLGDKNELRFECDRGNDCCSQDINFLAKIEPVELKLIRMISKQRMAQKKKLISIKNKFLNTHVAVYHYQC